MKKLIIANRGSKGQGKTSSIKAVFRHLSSQYPYKIFANKGDIKAIVDVEGVRVGIESQGDPNSRMMQSMDDFVTEECQIIVTACRTRGDTYNKVIELHKQKGYDLIWAVNDKMVVANGSTPQPMYDMLNDQYAQRVVDFIMGRIHGTF